MGDEHQDIGRFQLGQELPLFVVCRDGDGAPAAPAAAPVASFYAPGGGRVADVAVPHPRRARSAAVFAGPYRLGAGFAPGRYAVVYRFAVAGVTRAATATFEVLAGGDAAGPVVSARGAVAPDADLVLAQLGTGRIAVGRIARRQSR